MVVNQTNKRRTYDINDCKKMAEDKGGLCLSDTYKTQQVPMQWQCEFGHVWTAKFYSIVNGHWCHECSPSRKKNIEYCRKLAISKGGICLTNRYKNSKTKMRWQCKEGHEFVTILDSIIHSNIWCPYCSRHNKHINDIKKLAKDNEGLLLSKTYKNNSNKMLWQCKEGHKWWASYDKISIGQWCPECSPFRNRYTIDNLNEYAEERNGKCLSDKYINSKHYYKWQCEEEHEWEATWDAINNQKQWCPKCNGNESYILEDCQDVARARGGKCLSKNYINNYQEMIWECNKGHRWSSYFRKINEYGKWCPYCEFELIYEEAILFGNQKFPLFAFDMNNLINSLKKRNERKGLPLQRRLHPLSKIKAKYLKNKPYLAWFFVPKYYNWVVKKLPESEYIKWHVETNPKIIKGKKSIMDVDPVVTAIINHLIHKYHKQIDCFYYGMGDIDTYYPIQTAKSYGIKVIAVAIEETNVSGKIKKMVDDVHILYSI